MRKFLPKCKAVIISWLSEDSSLTRLRDRILVPYLFFLARFVLWSREPFIIGVTGTVGKTTTTAMIAAVLTYPGADRIVGSVWATSKNMNNDTGVPLTILQHDRYLSWRPRDLLAMCFLPFRALALATSSRYPKLLVLEYAAGWRGHVHRLAKLAPPRIAVVTTIGPGHLERFKNIQGVASEKSALVRAVPPSGLVILGDDHPYISTLEQETQASVLKVKGRGTELSQKIAFAIGRHLGISEKVMTSALRDYKPPPGRLNRLQCGNLAVIDGSYNANPLSMKFGLDTLAEAAQPGQRRVAILGVMAELGEEAPRYHAEVGAYVRSRTDIVIGVGELAKHYNPDHWFDSSKSCADHVEGFIRPGDCVLVKGSHSVRMGRVIHRLRQIGEGNTGSTPLND